MTILSLRSTHGEVKITDLTSTDEYSGDACFRWCSRGFVQWFVDVCELAVECEPCDDDISVLTFIGGYVSGSVSKKCNCSVCSSRLLLDKELTELGITSSHYLKILDRGGLKCPTDFTINICTITFSVFQCLLNDLEQEVLLCSNQRNILTSLSCRILNSVLFWRNLPV